MFPLPAGWGFSRFEGRVLTGMIKYKSMGYYCGGLRPFISSWRFEGAGFFRYVLLDSAQCLPLGIFHRLAPTIGSESV